MIVEILFIFIFLALVIMLSPVTISFNSARRNGIVDGFFSITWIIFIFSYSVRESRSEIKVLKKRLVRYSHEGETEIKEKSNRRIKSKKMPYHGNMLNLIRPMFQLLKDLVNCIKLESIDIEIKFGANDPEHTGILAGIFYAITNNFQKWNSAKLALDFEKPCLEWDMIAKGAITPIRMLPAIIKFITDRRVLSSGYQILRG